MDGTAAPTARELGALRLSGAESEAAYTVTTVIKATEIEGFIHSMHMCLS